MLSSRADPCIWKGFLMMIVHCDLIAGNDRKYTNEAGGDGNQGGGVLSKNHGDK